MACFLWGWGARTADVSTATAVVSPDREAFQAGRISMD